MRSAILLAFALVAGCAATPDDPTPAAAPGIAVVGAIGNSLMLGYNADDDHVGSAPEVAWATGDETWSVRARLGAAAAENVAEPGADAGEFLEQAGKLERADLVLVLMIDNAMCAGASDPLPSEASYEDLLREGVRHLLGRGMMPMLVTPPDLVAVAAASREKPPASDFVTFWATAQSCAADPRVAKRQQTMFEAIGRVAQEEGALHDHGADASLAWTPEMVSDVDGLHPSLLGLEAIATAVWDAYEARDGRG